MMFIPFILILFALLFSGSERSALGNHWLPNHRMTPGDVLTTRTKDICTPGWAGEHRHVLESTKRLVEADYSARGSHEIDHLISLQLGGSNARTNLWPQPYPDAYSKDSVENWLHREVCAGRKSLPVVQQQIAYNWVYYYHEMKRDKRTR